MSNPFNHLSFPSFDSIDYTLLDTNPNDCFPHEHDNFLSLESPPLIFEREIHENFEMEIECNKESPQTGINDEVCSVDTPFSHVMSENTESLDTPRVFTPKKTTIRIYIEIDDAIYINPAGGHRLSIDEEALSTTTKETLPSPFEHAMSFCLEGSLDDLPQEVQNEWKVSVSSFLEKRPLEERIYLQKIMPYLISSLKEAFAVHQQPALNKKMFETMLRELLYGKEIILGMDQKMIRNIVKFEMERVQNYRPVELKNPIQLINKRKEKKSIKGNKNHSSLNHMNENYVNNIFRFAKTTYPNDKELQKIAAQRGVSAVNFRNSMTPQLNDDILVRKAKVRIVASGQELVSNIEYWMNVGYFEGCKDQEKYVQYKQKAVCNLFLDRQY